MSSFSFLFFCIFLLLLLLPPTIVCIYRCALAWRIAICCCCAGTRVFSTSRRTPKEEEQTGRTGKAAGALPAKLKSCHMFIKLVRLVPIMALSSTPFPSMTYRYKGASQSVYGSNGCVTIAILLFCIRK